jgi:hypothetical protein
MLPILSNTADQGCSPVSSNCVIWQGPNLSCINLCKGDTVSDVVYKVATQLCTLQSELVLTDLDLSCLVSFCTSANPAPTTKTLAAVLDFIIDKVCCLNTRCTVLEGASAGTPYTEPTLNLPTCLQYTNPQGQTVTQLVHNQYTLTLATKFCELKTLVDTHTSQISTLGTRVTALENAGGAAATPTVDIKCLTGGTALLDFDTAIERVSTELCTLKGVLGTNTAITSASARQCTQLSTVNALSQIGTMSSISGWKTTVTTLSDSINNLWLTVCDMRGAIGALKDCCGSIDCSSVVIDFTATLNSTRNSLTIKFKGLTGYKGSTGLTGWTDGYNGDGARFTIKDASLNSQTFTIPVVANAAAAASDLGVTIALNTGTGTNQLRDTQNYTLSMNAAVVNSGVTCTRLLDKVLVAPCTTITQPSATVS